MPFELDETHNAGTTSWVLSANGHPDFPVQNLPLGIFSSQDQGPRAGTAIGDKILDLKAVRHILPGRSAPFLAGKTLNDLFAAEPTLRRELRRRIFELLTKPSFRDEVSPHLHDVSSCQLHLPAHIGDYTDFFAGIHHAVHAGALARPEDPLSPNYKWVPIGYHGRSSSVRPSGHPVTRPTGQALDGDRPVWGPARRLDYELEMGIWIGTGNALGQRIPIAEASDHIVGLCLINDWSARDIQMWEMEPLGPFLAKNFQTTVSPWVVTLDALAPFRTPQPRRPVGDPEPLPYLDHPDDHQRGAFAIELDVQISTAKMRESGQSPFQVSRVTMETLYWTAGQLIAHHTSGGCNLRPGDLLGTGTISPPDERNSGCLLEINRAGQRPLSLPSGEQRSMLEDGDEIILRGRATSGGFVTIGFGECRGRILPALPV